jgi:hypothetical protein
MEMATKPPVSKRPSYKMTRKPGIKSVSQNSAFSSLSKSSFMQMMSSPFKFGGGGLIPKEKLVREFMA